MSTKQAWRLGHIGQAGRGMVGVAHMPDGGERRRFVKDMMRTGIYEHPVEGWTLAVTPERMDRWVAAFRRMRAAGVDVEVVVDHRQDAAAVQGYVVDLFRQGEVLFGVHELHGAAATGLAERVKNVSILLERDFRDGQGRSYGEAITHSSLVQQPVVPGQGAFRQVAASRTGMARDERDETTSRGDGQMAKTGWDRLRALLGLDAEATAEQVATRAEERLTELERRNAGLQGQVEALENRLNAGSRAASHATDMNWEPLARAAERQLGLLVEAGKLTPAARDKAVAAFVGGPGARRALALKAEGTAELSLLDELVEVLRMNEPVVLGERTGQQSVCLSRALPGAREVDYDPELTRRMVKQANG